LKGKKGSREEGRSPRGEKGKKRDANHTPRRDKTTGRPHEGTSNLNPIRKELYRSGVPGEKRILLHRRSKGGRETSGKGGGRPLFEKGKNVTSRRKGKGEGLLSRKLG